MFGPQSKQAHCTRFTQAGDSSKHSALQQIRAAQLLTVPADGLWLMLMKAGMHEQHMNCFSATAHTQHLPSGWRWWTSAWRLRWRRSTWVGTHHLCHCSQLLLVTPPLSKCVLWRSSL